MNMPAVTMSNWRAFQPRDQAVEVDHLGVDRVDPSRLEHRAAHPTDSRGSRVAVRAGEPVWRLVRDAEP